MNSNSKINLVLVGGGQTHAPVLKKLGMKSAQNLKITLISSNSIVPYSGMLPGYIAGSYTKEECLIDLRHLSNYSGAVFIQAKVIGLDLQNKLVLLENRPAISFDTLSLNVGSLPDLDYIEGKNYISPIKPAISFFYQWIEILAKIKKGEFGNRFRVGIVGSGAGGIETALAIQKRLIDIIPNLEIHVFQRGNEILTGLSQRTKSEAMRVLKDRKIQLHLNEEICNVIKKSNSYICKTSRGNEYQVDFLVGTVKAKSLDWIVESELAKDKNGFVLVNDFLQSISHPDVFAVGDIASMQNYPRPKAGVFAVRHSVPLYQNFINLVEKKQLVKFIPQENFLTLLNTGDGKAIASRGNLSLGASKWIWKWKEKIDKGFMQSFQNLPVKMNQKMSENLSDELQCRGCGGKAESDILLNTLDRLEVFLKSQKYTNQYKNKFTKTLVGLSDREDSSVIQISKKVQFIQSVDYFHPILDDLFLAGKIAANHCLNDLYSKGVNAHSAQAIINLRKDSSQKGEDLFQILAGASSVFGNEGVELLGGHTNSSSEFGLGFVINGFSESAKFYSKKNAKTGDCLILTKPIGVGLVFAANMRNKVSPLTVDAAIQSMLQSNFTATIVLKDYNVGACTDVTGFGLGGHLLEILKASTLTAKLDLSKIPKLFELEKILIESPEIQSSLFPSNWKSFEKHFTGKKENKIYNVLFDPQTAGGLLFTLSAKEADKCILELKQKGYDAAIIGDLVDNKLSDNELVECH